MEVSPPDERSKVSNVKRVGNIIVASPVRIANDNVENEIFARLTQTFLRFR